MSGPGEARPRGLVVASWALAAVPLALLVTFLVFYTIDVPLWDSWPFALLLDRFYTHQLTFGDLWMAHNEHRPFFSRLVLLGLAWLTDWRIGWEHAVNVATAAASLAVVLAGARAALPDPRARSTTLVLLPALALLGFSLDQSYNWICGWQLQFFLNVLAVEGGLVLLARPGVTPARLLGAIALGVVATFTLASGFAIWPLGAAILAFGQGRPLDRRTWRALAAWSIAFAVVLALYVHGFGDAPKDARSIQVHPDRLFVFAHPFELSRFVLRTLGAPIVSHHRNGAAVAGALGLVALVVSVRTLVRRGVALRPFAALFAIGGYGLLNALALAVGRASFGRGNALLSRYMTLTTPFWLLVVVLLIALIQTTAKPAVPGAARLRFLPCATLAALLVAAAVNSALAFFHAREDYFAHMVPGREGVVRPDWELFRTHFVDVDGLPQTDQDRLDTLEQIAVLRRHHLGPFHENRGF